MNPQIFNACVALGWIMFVAGVMFVSLPLALIFGGLLLMATTIGLSYLFGIMRGRKKPAAEPPVDPAEQLFNPPDPEK